MLGLDPGVLSTVASVEEHINEKGYRTLRVKQHDELPCRISSIEGRPSARGELPS